MAWGKWRRLPGNPGVGEGGAAPWALPPERSASHGCGPDNGLLTRNWGPDAGGGAAGSGKRRRGEATLGRLAGVRGRGAAWAEPRWLLEEKDQVSGRCLQMSSKHFLLQTCAGSGEAPPRTESEL